MPPAPSIGIPSHVCVPRLFSDWYTWKQALGMVFLVALVDVINTLTKVRSMIVKAIPDQLKPPMRPVSFIYRYIGLKNAGFL